MQARSALQSANVSGAEGHALAVGRELVAADVERRKPSAASACRRATGIAYSCVLPDLRAEEIHRLAIGRERRRIDVPAFRRQALRRRRIAGEQVSIHSAGAGLGRCLSSSRAWRTPPCGRPATAPARTRGPARPCRGRRSRGWRPWPARRPAGKGAAGRFAGFIRGSGNRKTPMLGRNSNPAQRHEVARLRRSVHALAGSRHAAQPLQSAQARHRASLPAWRRCDTAASRPPPAPPGRSTGRTARLAGSASTSARPDTTIGIAIAMPISASPVIRPAENSVPGRWMRSFASSSSSLTPVLALDEVREQAAEEDRHHQFQRQVDADRRGQHRHAEFRAARLQPFVERDDRARRCRRRCAIMSHGSLPPNMPFATDAISVACGADSELRMLGVGAPMP